MITACPRCGYSLEGLPDEHACPECGLPYHRQAVAIKQTRNTAWAIASWIPVAFFAAVNAVKGEPLFAVLMLMGVVVGVAAMLWRRQAPTNMVLVSPHDIRLHHSDGRIESIPMGDVANAKWSFVTGDIIIRRADGSVLRRLHPPFLASASRARRLAEVIRAFKRPEGT
jgi:uncharacterized protein (DUF983 family)